MRALVIGAGGFVGRHLVDHLCQCGDEVFATSLKSDFADPSVTVLGLDITDPRAVGEVINQTQPEVVYHLAGIAFVPEAESNFERALSVNVAGTANIARQCQFMGNRPKLIFVSSAEVYGHVKPNELPISESNELRPANNYSLSKSMAELVVERYGRQGLNHSIVRPFNHIGPGQDSRFVASNFALQLARVARGLTPPVLEVGNLEARRDFSDARDIVRAYRLIAGAQSGIYNLGSGRSYAIKDVLDLLIEISGCKVEIRQDPERMRGPEVFELYGSVERISKVAGWRPELSLKRSLEDTYHYWFQSLT